MTAAGLYKGYNYLVLTEAQVATIDAAAPTQQANALSRIFDNALSISLGEIGAGSVDTDALAALAVTNAKVSASAAIAFSKLAALTAANILVGNASNVPTAVAMSGDATLSNAGAITIANSAVSPAKQSAAARTRTAIVPFKLIAPSGSNQGPFTKCVWQVGQASTIVSVKIASDVATTGSDATNNYSFLPRNNTQAVNLSGAATTTQSAELSSTTLKTIAVTQNLAFVANDVFVITMSIADDGSAGPTDLSGAQTYAIIEYTI